MFDRLLAKSRDEQLGHHMFLPQHLWDAHRSARQIVEATGAAQLRAFGLEATDSVERFCRVVLLAATVHDLGKANDHFQGMIHRRPDRFRKPQGLRHEWVTWLILQRADVREWLLPSLGQASSGSPQAVTDDWLVMTWAVTGHHPAFGRPSPPEMLAEGCGSEITLLLGHQDFGACLEVLAESLELDRLRTPQLKNETISLPDALSNITRETNRQRTTWDVWKDSRRSPGMVGFVAAVKNCLVAADVAGSALPQSVVAVEARQSWIPSVFARLPQKTDLDELIADRLTDKTTGQVQELRPFQKDVALLAGDVTLVKAGCGSGKTLAAYHWARERHPGIRLYVCYPTTGTATEGFRDYVFDESIYSPKFGARLFHGRASVDLELILGMTDRDGDDNESDALARIESLDAWDTPIVTCTVDTVLGLMQNHRRGIYSWPALAGAAFVFDEIHAYDANLFGALLRFVRELRGVPMLLMTASLPEHRLNRLKQAVNQRGSTLAEVNGPDDLETRPRYHRATHALDSGGVISQVAREVARPDLPGKVLWVCNTVDRAIAAAERCREIGLIPLIYHSRFRYEDRLTQHRHVIAAFKQADQPALAICTQVAEMSLDLSATLLVTELAPISALIQRLGRLNRRAKHDDPTCPFLVVTPHKSDGGLSPLPYDEAELQQAEQWLALLPDAINQRDLVQVWSELSTGSAAEKINTDCHWLDGGPRRLVKELRKASPGITVLMSEDVSDVMAKRKKVAEVLLPMNQPRGLNWRDWDDYRGIPVAPAGTISYSRDQGARWLRQSADTGS